jgi:prepilin-type N-terminal cleavage/methylation domain-containing protein
MKNKTGLTLIEMMVAIAIAAIVVLGMGAVLSDAQKGYNKMYDRINSPVVNDGYGARRAFDAVIRKASTSITAKPEITASSVKVFCFSSPSQLTADRFANFYLSNGQLILDEGDRASGAVLSSRIIANNVVDVDFESKDNACIQMILSLDNGKESLIVTSSAIRHNP